MMHFLHHCQTRAMRHLFPLHCLNAVAQSGSIRKAADTLSLTSTALNRRILAMEEELGVQLFERLPRGVRLSAAGEILLHHFRTQLSDMERVKSQIADLSGGRRGNVSIACSQALLPYFLPEQIAAYHNAHAAVTFGVHLRDRAAAEKALVDLSADLALVFEPVSLSSLQILMTVRQPVYAIMKADHPLAGKEVIRLRDCLHYPIALPTAPYGVRNLLELAVHRTSLNIKPVIESDSFEFLRHQALSADILTFQIAVGVPDKPVSDGLAYRRVDERDVPLGLLYVCQLRGRVLTVAASHFVNQILASLAARFECD